MSPKALVTGATSGIGAEAAVQLAEAGYGQVVVSGRTAHRASTAAHDLAVRAGAAVFEPLALDLGDPASIEAAVGELAGEGVDAVILNAGLLSPAERQFTTDGIELTFAASLIGHHRLLMGLLANGGLSAEARVVIAGSEAARGDVPMMTLADLDQLANDRHAGDLTAAATDLIRGVEPKKFKPNDTYATTKLFVAWWAAALARRLPDTMTVTAVSPGSTPDTQAGRQANFLTRRVMVPMLKLMPKHLNMAAPISTDLTMAYVGEDQREIASAITAGIWSGAWFVSAKLFEWLRAANVAYWEVFFLTAILYGTGILAYGWLIRDHERREAATQAA